MRAFWRIFGLSAFLGAAVLCSTPEPVLATEPVSLTVLTLDDRPANNLFLKQLAAVAGIDIRVVFDPSLASTADCVSLNAAVAGSLVGSRTADPWLLEPPVVRSDALLHFAVPRIEPTVTEQSLLAQYSAVRQRLADPAVQNELLAAVRDGNLSLSDEFLGSFACRMRGWLNFLERGNYDPDRLLITLDDNRPGPLSDGLKLILQRYSRHVYDGTDEGMMLLVARALRERQSPCPATLGITWTDPADLVSVMPVEGGMVVENVLKMADWLSLRITPRVDLVDPWRPVLWVHGSGAPEDRRPGQVTAVSNSLGERPVIVADIAKTNMGDTVLIRTWSDGATPDGLLGYVAWNTSSNTLGTAIALWAAMDFAYWHGADPEGVRAAAETFLWARFLDDYLYQARVRAEVRDAFVASGGDQFRLTPEEVTAQEAAIARRLTELWSEMGVPLALPLRYVNPGGHTRFVVELPWSRFFEIALYPTDDRGVLPVILPAEEDHTDISE